MTHETWQWGDFNKRGGLAFFFSETDNCLNQASLFYIKLASFEYLLIFDSPCNIDNKLLLQVW